MEPRIQYATTTDGVSIAFWTLGEGKPLVYIWPSILSNIQLEWQLAEWRGWYEGLTSKRMLVRYDTRGSGLSDRHVTDFSLDAHLMDLEAVVNRLGLDRFDALGYMQGGPVAIAYAADHSGGISRLILWDSWAQSSDFFDSTVVQGLNALRDTDWDGYIETLVRVYLTRRDDEDARRYLAAMRESVIPEVIRAQDLAFESVDVSALLPRVTSPTLVLQPRQVRVPGVEVARRLASRIQDARLVLVEGGSPAPFLCDTDAVLRAIDEFLAEGEEPAAGPAPSGLVTILFTDIEGSTTLTQRLGDAKAQEVLRTHNRILRDALKAQSGSEIKHTGDGIMASFGSASRALECAIAIQRALAQHNESSPDTPIRVRIGLNAGEPLAEEKDLFGTAVQLAARICAHAEAGEIVAANVIRELAAGKGFLFSDRGDVALRGFEDPVRLYEVRWRA